MSTTPEAFEFGPGPQRQDMSPVVGAACGAGGTSGELPAAHPAPESSATWRLAGAFAQEPELILACLQNSEHDSPAGAELILEAAQLAVVEHPAYADLLYCASQAALRADRHETAGKLLAHALQINPDYRDALILAARVALLRSKPQQATSYLERALCNGADYPDVHMLLGDLWRQEGHCRLARAAYKRALELNADLTAARAALAALPSTDVRGLSDELPA